MENIILSGGNTELPINLRQRPATNSNLLAEIPQGATCTMIERGEKWSKIEYKGKKGYVLTTFVMAVDGENSDMAFVRKHLAVIDSEMKTILDYIGRG